MEYAVIITILVIVVAMVLFAFDIFPVDHVAIGAMAVLAVTGVLTPEEAVMGFSNTATITVAAMFVLSDVIIKAGIIDAIAPAVSRLFRRGPTLIILGMNTVVGSISAFINNTPVVATFIPVVSEAAIRSGNNPSKYLIPLSYGAIFGGTCTLIGTSTNLLVSGIAESHGEEPFSMFLMAPMGLVFFALGTTYMMFIGHRLTPKGDDSQPYGSEEKIQNFLSEIRVVANPGEEEEEAETTLDSLFGKDKIDVDVERIKRGKEVYTQPDGKMVIEADDVLLVRGNMKNIKRVVEHDFLEIGGPKDAEFPDEETLLVEIVILPNSELGYKKLSQVSFLQQYNATVLAIRQRGSQKFSDLKQITLKPGDILLLQTNQPGYKMLQETEKGFQAPFMSMRQLGVRKPKIRNMVIVGTVIAAVILLASTGIMSIMIAAIAAIVLLGFMGQLRMGDVYRAIDWQVIFLLAGALSLGQAMDKSGISGSIGSWLVNNVGVNWGPIAVVSALYLITVLLTEVMSNNASAALMAPIAISIASVMALSPTPFLLAVTFAGSASFMTPIGYQTNTMVYSAGNYSFFDFTKVGAPLSLLFWLVASLLIPVFYPF